MTKILIIEEDKKEAMRLGADYYMAKPFSMSKLNDLISKLYKSIGAFRDSNPLYLGGHFYFLFQNCITDL